MNTVHLIGGEKGGVGKSVLARLLCQYFIDHQEPFRGFDADASHPALVRYYSNFAETIELSRFESCDHLVTAAINGVPLVVDLPAQSNRPLTDWMQSSGVTELALELGIRFVRWHVMDDGKDSLGLLEQLLEKPEAATDYVIVQNLGAGQDFEWMQHEPGIVRAHEIGAHVMQLAALHHNTMSKIDRMDASFWAACNNSDGKLGPCLNLIERQRVKVWVRRAYAQFVNAHASLRLPEPKTVAAHRAPASITARIHSIN